MHRFFSLSRCGKLLLLSLGVFSLLNFVSWSPSYGDVTLNGSGGTSCAPLYQRWAAAFHEQDPSVEVNYQGVGSSAGISHFKHQLAEFAATDIALSDQEIEALHGNVVMIPITAGMIVFAYNLPGDPVLKLSPEVYTAIFLGKITSWDDPAIKKLNPDVPEEDLKDIPITLVTRSDGSGTTEMVTTHLSAVSKKFVDQVGKGKSVPWPTGISAKGNDGVTATIRRTPGGFGYVEYSYAKQNELKMASLQNQSGAFVAPSEASGIATLQEIKLSKTLAGFNSNPSAANAYPIAGFNWLLFRKEYPQEEAAAIRRFLQYALGKEEGDAEKRDKKHPLNDGQKVASTLGYLPLPDVVCQKDREAAKEIRGIKDDKMAKETEANKESAATAEAGEE